MLWHTTPKKGHGPYSVLYTLRRVCKAGDGEMGHTGVIEERREVVHALPSLSPPPASTHTHTHILSLSLSLTHTLSLSLTHTYTHTNTHTTTPRKALII